MNKEEVLVKGYGKLTRQQIKDKIKRTINDVKSFSDKEDFKNVKHLLYWTGVLETLLNAEVDLQEKEENNGKIY
jgi:hypothetical protein